MCSVSPGLNTLSPRNTVRLEPRRTTRREATGTSALSDVTGRLPTRPVTRYRESVAVAQAVGSYPGPVDLEFSGEIWFWRGPAPWYFVTVPDKECRELATTAELVSYGWGVIPVAARIGATGWATSLFPKDGRYLVPVKAAVRQAEGIEEGDLVTVRLTVDV